MVAPRHPYDLQLVKEARRGRGRALPELTERLMCVPNIVRALHHRGGGHLAEGELEDVIQESLASIWAKLGEFHGGSKLESWFFGFCLRHLRRAYHAKQRLRRVDLEESPELFQSEPGRESQLEPELLHDSLEQIGPPVSDIIRDKHFQHLTFEEIAERLPMPVNTVKSHYYRGIRRLKTLLAPHVEERP